MRAGYYGDVKVSELLLNRGADINLKNKACDILSYIYIII
jgi:hypothetical protein